MLTPAGGRARGARRKYTVDIDAPRSVRSLLKDHLDLARFAKRDDVSDEQFEFLVTATPQEVRDLVATDGYFTPVVRTDVTVADDKKTVTVSVDPGPQTTVASVSLTFKGAVTTEDPQAGKRRALRVFGARGRSVLAGRLERRQERVAEGACRRAAISARKSRARRRG